MALTSSPGGEDKPGGVQGLTGEANDESALGVGSRRGGDEEDLYAAAYTEAIPLAVALPWDPATVRTTRTATAGPSSSGLPSSSTSPPPPQQHPPASSSTTAVAAATTMTERSSATERRHVEDDIGGIENAHSSSVPRRQEAMMMMTSSRRRYPMQLDVKQYEHGYDDDSIIETSF